MVRLDAWADGVFAVHDLEAACTPVDIWVGRWAMPGHFGNAEVEEAVARVLSFSKDAGFWVGVTWERFAQMVYDDLNLYVAWDKYNEDEAAGQTAWVRFWRWVLRQSHTAPMKPEAEAPMTVAVLGIGSVQNLLAAVKQLAMEGLLEEVPMGDDPMKAVLCPTSALIERIAARQKVGAA